MAKSIELNNNIYWAPNSVVINSTGTTLADIFNSSNKIKANYLDLSGLATVATSGSYNDLSNKPTIPTADSGLTNDRYVRFDTASQGLNSTQKSNARTNIGAGTSNFSGNYNDLSNKPTVDQTYNASSANAQSGTAVASAIASAITTTLNTPV